MALNNVQKRRTEKIFIAAISRFLADMAAHRTQQYVLKHSPLTARLVWRLQVKEPPYTVQSSSACECLAEPPGQSAHSDKRNRDSIHLEVQNIVRSTGEFVDDLTARYFRNFHVHLPIISRRRFQDNLIASTGAPPSADSSVLLLTICLIAYLPNPELSLQQHGDTPVMGRQSLYLATKALLAQLQGSLQPSVALIQACLLLATYEYANGRPEVALVTIAGCARMAYAARIHNIRHHDNINGDSRLEVEEARNTWWGIVVFER